MSEHPWDLAGLAARTTRTRLMLLAAAFAAGFGVLYALAVHTSGGRAADDQVRLWIVRDLDMLNPVGSFLRNILPLLLAIAVVLLALVALWRRRWAAVTVSLVVTLSTVLIARNLRLQMPRPGDEYSLSTASAVNTYPSGHVAATTALVVALLLLWPRPVRRGGLVVGGTVVASCAFASVVTHAHRPSDVVAGVLLVLALTTLALAVAGPSTTVAPYKRRQQSSSSNRRSA